MKIKNVKSPKQPGGRYIKKIQKYENKGRRNSVVIASNTLYFVVDERYEKKCRKYMKKYEDVLQGKKTGILILVATGALATAAVAWLLTHQKPSIQTSSISFLEIQDNTVDNIEETNGEEIEIVECEIIDEVLEARKQIEMEYVSKKLWIELYDSYIEKYCGYFHFDSDKVVKLARNMTNNYEDFSGIITEEECDLNNPEAVCMQFVCKLFKNEPCINWEELGFTNEDIVLTNEITISDYDDLNTFYLHGGLKYSEFMEKYCDMLKIDDKVLALSVSIEEIGKEGSRLAREQNNFGGIRIDGVWLSFPTPEAGIIYYCSMFKNSYNNYTVEDTYKMSYKYIGKNDNQEAERRQWSKDVTSFYNEIQDNYDFYFLDNQGPEPDSDVEDETQEITPHLIRIKSKAV